MKSLLLFSTLLWALAAGAADINKGYTFAPSEQNVTHTKLNNLVDLATINSSFLTDKAVAAPSAADSFLFYSAGSAGLRRATYDSLFLGNTNLIAGQNDLATPATNDFLLVLSAAGLYYKTTLNGIWTNSALLADRTAITNPPPANLQFLVSSNGSYFRIGLSNIFREWWKYSLFSTNGYPTNAPLLTYHSSPTNNDLLWIWDSVNSSNKTISLAGLITNLPAGTTFTNTDSFILHNVATNAANPYGTNPALVRMSLGQLATQLSFPGGTNQVALTNQLPKNFTSALIPLTIGTNTAAVHGFTVPTTGTNSIGVVPQLVRWVLVCGTNDLGYLVGDEVGTEGCNAAGASSIPNFHTGASTTNVWLTVGDLPYFMMQRDVNTGARATVTANRWRAKCYATYFP